MSDIAARLERLPFARPHRKLLVMGGLGYTFAAMDGAMIAFVLPVLAKVWSLSSVQTGILGSGTFIGFFFGAFCSGTLGDLVGRRVVMMWALAIYSIGTLGSAMADSWPSFLALRILVGFGLGAESAIVAPFLSEFVASRYRGTFTGALAGFFSFGFVAAALLGYLIVPSTPQGWRIVLVVTALPIVMLLWWRRSLPESPRWLVSRGRVAEADALVSRMEADIRAEHGQEALPPLVPVPQAPQVGGTFAKNLAALWSPALTRVTLMCWLAWLSITFCYYAFFTWIPTLLVQNGLTITRSFSYSLAIFVAQIPGYYSAAYLNEKIGRQATITSYMVLGGLAAFALSAAASNEWIMITGMFLSFFMNGTYAGLYAYTPELYPTQLRATGAGVASSVGRIGAISGPIVVGYLFPRFGFVGVFGISTAILLAAALAVMILGVRTRGRSLEAIAADELRGVADE